VTETVHVITDLGPTDGPGLVVPAQMLGNRPRFSWPPHIAEWEAAWRAGRHTNHPCYLKPVFTSEGPA
jgi:hypothetical protein